VCEDRRRRGGVEGEEDHTGTGEGFVSQEQDFVVNTTLNQESQWRRMSVGMVTWCQGLGAGEDTGS